MRKRKIRGHKRLQKQIPIWIANDSTINIDFLLKHHYWYSDVLVHPWCDISIVNSEFPEPKSKTRNQITLALEEIYNNWKLQLESLKQPFYLKIWLYEPRISKSQVVCAIGEKIAHYEKAFEKSDTIRRKSDFYNKLSSDFCWESSEDFQVWSEEDLLSPIEMYKTIEDYRYNIKLLKKIRKANYKTIPDENDLLHLQPKGVVWIGEKK